MSDTVTDPWTDPAGGIPGGGDGRLAGAQDALPITIRSVQTSIVEIPFDDGGKGGGITPTAWRTLEILLVRVEDELGNVGWGEGFGYFTVDATKALVDRLITPVLVGTMVSDIGAWNLATQRRLHLFGRYGVTVFAISAVDMALWDLAAKRAGAPLHRLLSRGAGTGTAALVGASGEHPAPGAAPRLDIPFYASLVRYADTEAVARMARRAVAHGFKELKLHELTVRDIAAARAAVGDGIPMAVDVNCNWTSAMARELAPELRALGVSWLEEPVFPPEDFKALAALSDIGVPVAAGENWCTSVQFASALEERAVAFTQPSVTKVGGVSEFLRVADVSARHGVPLLPHCPYFGPGYFASLHLAAALPNVRALEYHFVDVEAWLAQPGRPDAAGRITVPDAHGLGFEPDPEVLAKYTRARR
mgnify:CR=1 FL=1